NLTGMIQIVGRNPIYLGLDRPARAPAAAAQIGFAQRYDGAAEQAVLLVEQCAIAPPSGFIGGPRRRNPIVPLAWEGNLGVAQQPPAHHAFPVRGVEHQVPDAVSLGAGTPERLACA